MKIFLKKKSWAEITIADYERLLDIWHDDAQSTDEKDIATIAVLCEVGEDDIWNLTVDEVKMLKMQAWFLNAGFDYPKKISFKKIRIGDWVCTVNPDITKMTYAQFVDYQTYLQETDVTRVAPKDKAAILSVFFIPDGHSYGDGYDALALQQAIRENVSMLTYNTVWFFFLRRLRKQLRNTAIYSASRMKAMSLLMRRSNPLRKKYREAAEATLRLPDLVG